MSYFKSDQIDRVPISLEQQTLPLVSVIIPAYRAEKFIETTLRSVLGQTYPHLEVIVIDDGNCDRTPDIVKALMREDPRIILLRQPNAGVAAARNLGIQFANGEIIAPIDADDIWYPQNLEKQVQAMMQGGDTVGLVYAWSLDINEFEKPTGGMRASLISGHTFATLICHNFIGNSSAAIFRRSCLEKLGAYSTALLQCNAQGCEDWDLYLRIAKTYQVRCVPEFLIGYRKISSSMSGDLKRMARSHDLVMERVKQNSPNIPDILFALSSSSFYMYLARQAHMYRDPKGTLYWLSQALRKDYLTPPFRYGFYVMGIKSILDLIRLHIRSRDILVPETHKNIGLQLKLTLGYILHQTLRIVN